MDKEQRIANENLKEFIRYSSSPWRIVWTNFVAGIFRGLGTFLDCKGYLVQSNGKFTAIIGVDDLVVVNTDDATLIVPKDKVEKVKDLVGWLEKKNHKKLL